MVELAPNSRWWSASCCFTWPEDAVAERLERWNITAPMVFVTIGLLLANGPTGVLDVARGGLGITELAEFALAVVLFGDAAGVWLRRPGAGDVRAVWVAGCCSSGYR